ncbi:MAG: AAC(3) family N-acetyltransferase [Anaerolineae bacterium]
MSEAEAIRRTGAQPITSDSLVADLRALGLQAGMIVLVHSSLSQLGWVCGGPVAVVEALQTVLGPKGTLVMPTHSTALTDPAYWQNPPVPESWWQTIRDTMPPYNPALTPTRQMGAIVEYFRTQPAVLRSAHPQLSFAARGPAAGKITANHPLAYALGEQSPLARLYELGAWVLLLGVGHSNNTSLHLAEYRANFPGKRTVQQGAPILVNGQRKWVTFEDIDLNDDDFPAIGAAFERTGQVRIGRVGAGEARLMSQPALVDFGTEWIENNRVA